MGGCNVDAGSTPTYLNPLNPQSKNSGRNLPLKPYLKLQAYLDELFTINEIMTKKTR
jgi:hypothetical protein